MLIETKSILSRMNWARNSCCPTILRPSEFEKPIDIFMPEDDPSRLDVWVSTRDNRYLNIELQNKVHSFLFDRMQIYNADLTLRGKYEYNRSERFKNLSEEERKRCYYELPEK